MVKTHVNLFIDAGIVEVAKSKGINLSRFCESALEVECGMKTFGEDKSKDEIIEELKTQNAHLTTQLKEATERIKSLVSKYEKVKEQKTVVMKPVI